MTRNLIEIPHNSKSFFLRMWKFAAAAQSYKKGLVLAWATAAAAIAALWLLAPPDQRPAPPSASAIWDGLWASGGGAFALFGAMRMVAIERIHTAFFAIIATIACFLAIIGTNLVLQGIIAFSLSAEIVLGWPAALGPAVGIVMVYAGFGRWWDWAPWTIAAWLVAQHLQMGPRSSSWLQWDWAQIGLFGALILCLLAHLLRGRHE